MAYCVPNTGPSPGGKNNNNKPVINVKYGPYHAPENLDLQVLCAKLSAMIDSIGLS